MTEMIYAAATDPAAPLQPTDPKKVLTDLLDSTDVEDVVLLRLQTDGWLLLPSSRMNDTPLYEAALRHRDDGRLAVVAVKSGAGNQVPVQDLMSEADGAEVFVYSTHGSYTSPPTAAGATEVTHAELIDFLGRHPELLPPRIKRWLKPSGSSI